eukprot:TRINITY_DN19212_c0_g1_i1.p1 TRINITY_DN19212_c0_g1~~TRINITY_DN19212_c0_g1_i1.p1  ORF type:complete len:357 (+),score=59.79 TRINITY_DN19212_c0_g1_i1:682-1752(+)
MSLVIRETYLDLVRANIGELMYLPLLSDSGADVVGQCELRAGIGGVVVLTGVTTDNTCNSIFLKHASGREESLSTGNLLIENTPIFDKLTGGFKTTSTNIPIDGDIQITTIKDTEKSHAKAGFDTAPTLTPHIAFDNAIEVSAVYSLGLDCVPAQAIRQSGLHAATGPLDWLRVGDLKTLIPLLRRDVAQSDPFHDVCYLEWVRDNEFVTSASVQKHVFDPKYRLISSHHDTDTPFSQFDRRWSRFMSCLESAENHSKSVIFVVSGRQPSSPLIVDGVNLEVCQAGALRDFVSSLNQVFPALDFAVLAFNIPDTENIKSCYYYDVGWCSSDQHSLVSEILSDLVAVESTLSCDAAS